jgi:twitching motility protein PilT
MSLVPSLLQAIVRVDGEALVMHAGDKPYVVSPAGQVELASRGLTLEAVNGLVGQLLSEQSWNALDEFGAVQYELPPVAEFPHEHFTVVAARGGDDLWVEIRRHCVPDDDRVPDEFFAAPASTSSAIADPAPPVAMHDDDEIAPEVMATLPISEPAPAFVPVGEPPVGAPEDAGAEGGNAEDLMLPGAQQLWPAETESLEELPADADTLGPLPLPVDEPVRQHADVWTPPTAAIPHPVEPPETTVSQSTLEIVAVSERTVSHRASAQPPASVAAAHRATPPSPVVPVPEPVGSQRTPAPQPAAPFAAPPPVTAPSRVVVVPEPTAPYVAPMRQPVEHVARVPHAAEDVAAVTPVAAPPVVTEMREPPAPRVETARSPQPTVAPPSPPLVAAPEEPAHVAPVRSVQLESAPAHPALQPAVVLPITRTPIRVEPPLPAAPDPTLAGLERLLRLSAARGASTLYLSSESQPSVRVDGELETLEGEGVLTARDVESLLLTLMPERSHEALRTGAATEWICDIEDVGRVRCMSFRDHLGPGGVFRLMPTRTVSVEQLALPRAVQALAIEPEGLVLIVGPRSSGKRTLMSAFIDLINRTRRDHVITIEREINIVHPRGSSFISQREVRGGDEELLTAARAALREDPDVLVVEDLRTGGLMNVALEASASGRLVIGGFSAHTATAAIDRIIDLYAPEYRRQVQLALADNLRGVIVQVLLRKIGGGRTSAREVLLNTPAVSSVIAEGKTSQLPMAIEGGRRYGMVPLSDALVGLVHAGAVDAREAYRHASDRGGLLAALKRQGIDTSFAERLA